MNKLKLAKGFLIALAGLFTMITLVSLLMPSNVVTSKSVVIKADKAKIAAVLFDFAQWRNWHPIFIQDSGSLVISKPSHGVGASAEWGQNDKRTKLIITNTTANAVMIDMSYPGENTVKNSLKILPLDGSTDLQVEWSAVTKLKWYPWEKFSGIFVSQLTGPGYEMALDNLKTFVESGAVSSGN